MTQVAGSEPAFTLQLGPIELDDTVRYAGAAGDFNPMHFDRELARNKGFQDSYAQGMLTAGLAGVALGERFGPERIRRFGIRFVSPLWLGDAPAIAAVEKSSGADSTGLELTIKVGEREVATGWLELKNESEN